jgi:hypothetical protein
MLPNLDTYATALSIDRDLALKRAERRACLPDTGDRQDATTPAIARPPATATAGRSSLARAVASLLAVLRPSHA